VEENEMIKFDAVPHHGHIRIYIGGRYAVRFTITEMCAEDLALFLEGNMPKHSTAPMGIFSFGSAEGISYDTNWEHSGSVIIKRKCLPSVKVELERKIAKDLSNKIKKLIQSITTPTHSLTFASSKNIPIPDEDPMAGAKRRTNENLDSVFG
jgi:hypothetical protein